MFLIKWTVYVCPYLKQCVLMKNINSILKSINSILTRRSQFRFSHAHGALQLSHTDIYYFDNNTITKGGLRRIVQCNQGDVSR